MADDVAQYFIFLHNNTKNRFYIIPGGTSPVLFYSIIARKIINWKNTNFLLSDERLVNDISKYSNKNMVKNNLIDKIAGDTIPALIEYSFKEENREEDIDRMNMVIGKYNIPEIAILGFGSDGHTASLFPDHPEIFDRGQGKCIILKNNNEHFYRVSLSFEFLLQSKQIIFMISGNDKRRALKDALYGKYQPMIYPAQYIFRNYKKQITIFCDRSVYPDSFN